LGRNSREGSADIGVDPRTPQTYQAGALLANGARLVEIFSDYVVLTRDDRSTRLFVEGQSAEVYTADPSVAAPAQSLLTVGGQPPRAIANADSHEVLTDFIRVTPVFDGQRVRALEVYANPLSDVFDAMGLKPGDQITSIDGEPIADVVRAIASLRHLTTGQALAVELERGGEAITISLDGTVMVNAQPGI
jgi:general secretion pathway protein C